MEDRWHSYKACCHKVVLLMSYASGQVRYGIGVCEDLEDSLKYCKIDELFARHEAALYKRNYFHFGIASFWDSAVEEIKKNRMEETYCDEDNFPVSPEPVWTNGGVSILLPNHNPAMSILLLFYCFYFYYFCFSDVLHI